MWCPDGYVLFSELIWQMRGQTNLILRADDARLHRDPEKDLFGIWQDSLTQEERDGYLNWLLCFFHDALRNQFRVCLESGAVVAADPDLFDWFESDLMQEFTSPNDVDDLAALVFEESHSYEFPNGYCQRVALSKREFPYVEHRYGTLKTDVPWDGLFPARRLNGLPICFHLSDLPCEWTEIGNWIVAEGQRMKANGGKMADRREVRDLPSRIVEAYGTQRVRNKDEARKMFAKGLKHDVWTAVWKEARTLDPTISKPGRK